MLDGVFEPGDAGLLQDATSLHGLGELPAFCGVDQDADIRPYRLSDCLDAACLSLWARLMAQTHFDGRIPVRDMATGRFYQFVQRQAIPQPIAGIGWYAVAVAPQQAIQRLS